MADHLDRNELERYRDRQLGARELLRIDRHLTACSECKEALTLQSDSRVAAARIVSAAKQAGVHLTYEQLEAFVDGKLSDAGRANVDAHVKACVPCARELADMQGFARELARPVEPQADPAPSLLSRLTGWIGVGPTTVFGGVAGIRAAATVFVIVIGVALLMPQGVEHDRMDTALVLNRSIEEAVGAAKSFQPGEFDQRPFATLGALAPDMLAAFRSGNDTVLAGDLQDRAARGEAAAQSALALLYLSGDGVAHDVAEAKRLLEQAAAQGDASATHNLGVLYGRGLLGAKDESEAQRWYERAKQAAEAKR